MTPTADLRIHLVDTARTMVALKLNSGTVGNLSLRNGDGMLITPTGIAPGDLQPEQIVQMDLAGHWEGHWKPSSEWAIHARLYQTIPAAGGVIHAHPDHCVALASMRQPIPAFHYMVASFGGDVVPCASYACFGSAALAQTVVDAMGTTYSACLMANHGIVTIGQDLPAALLRAKKLEILAKQYLLARAAGEPVLLDEEELAEVHQRYDGYGQQGVI